MRQSTLSLLRYGLLRGACHRARISRDPLARNDGHFDNATLSATSSHTPPKTSVSRFQPLRRCARPKEAARLGK